MTTNFKENSELAHILSHRRQIIDSQEAGIELPRALKSNSLYREFQEFSRNDIKAYENIFNSYGKLGDGLIRINELKLMMEKLGAPQTHLNLKKLIAEMAEDSDDKITFREFLLIYRKVKSGELVTNTAGYKENVQSLPAEIDVDKVGVKGATNFFETKIKQQQHPNQNLEDDQPRQGKEATA